MRLAGLPSHRRPRVTSNVRPRTTPPHVKPGSSYFCNACASAHGLLAELRLPSASASPLQERKAQKHIGATIGSTGVTSVLDSGSTADLDKYTRLALAHGFLEVEIDGSRTLTYPTTGQIGTQFAAGAPGAALDCFRLVLSTASSLGHGYPVSSTQYAGAKCAQCGATLFR